MRLDEVRELKRRLIRELASGAPPSAAGAPGGGRLWPRAQPPLALGVARGADGGHRLAVRVQRTPPGFDAVLDAALDNLAAAGRHAATIDLRLVGYVLAQHARRGAARRRWRPLVLGCSLGHRRGRAGSLGAVVTAAAGGRALLSCAHVLTPFPLDGHGGSGDGGVDVVAGGGIVQPAVDDGGRFPSDRVGRLLAAVGPDPRRRNRFDAALATLVSGVGCDARRLPGLGRLAGVRRAPLAGGEPVYKVGRTSGVTRGRVSAVEVDGLTVSFPGGEALFDGQFEVEPVDSGRPFSAPGDSGALVVDEALRAVGLLFAGNGLDVSYAHPIAAVLDRLRVRLA